jgi:hypothetical protein
MNACVILVPLLPVGVPAMPLINPVAPNTVPALPLLPLLPKPQARVGQLKGYNQGLVPIVSHEVSILHTMPLMAGGKAAKDALKRVEQAIQSAFPGLTAGVGAIAEDTAKALNKQA